MFRLDSYFHSRMTNGRNRRKIPDKKAVFLIARLARSDPRNHFVSTFRVPFPQILEYFVLLYTANISAVKITVFRRVMFPTVFSLYFLH